MLATKLRFAVDEPPGEGLAADRVRAACDASLRRLGVDVIDLYQVHAPGEETPLEEPAPPPALYPHRMLVDQVGLSRMTLPLRRP